MCLPWANIWEYFLLKFTFWKPVCFILNVHSGCSGFLETREVNFSLYKTDAGLHHSAFTLGWELQGFYGPGGFWHSAVTFPRGSLQAVRAHGTLNFMRGHDSHSPGCHVWRSQRRWGLTESSLPNSLWRKSAHSPSDSLGDEHCSITGPSPDEYLFSSTLLLSLLPHSLLSSDSSRTLAKPL